MKPNKSGWSFTNLVVLINVKALKHWKWPRHIRTPKHHCILRMSWWHLNTTNYYQSLNLKRHLEASLPMSWFFNLLKLSPKLPSHRTPNSLRLIVWDCSLNCSLKIFRQTAVQFDEVRLNCSRSLSVPDCSLDCSLTSYLYSDLSLILPVSLPGDERINIYRSIIVPD